MRDAHLHVDGWLEQARRATPDKLALVCGAARLTFAQLAERSARVANMWRGHGLAAGARVAVLASNGIESAELLFGSAQAGVVAVPINFRLTAHEVSGILASAGAHVLVARERHRAVVEGVVAGGYAGHVLWLGDAYEAALAQASSTWAPSAAGRAGRSAAEPFLQIYTSGTTGQPKGVMISHRNVAAFAWTNEAEGSVRRDDVHVVATPLCFGAPAARLLMNVHIGATSVVMSDFDAEALLALLRGGDVSTCMVVPAMLRVLNEHASASGEPVASPRLRLVMYGGAPMPPDVIAAARARFRCGFYQGYGLTETLTVTTLRPEDHEGDGDAAHLARLGSVGRPASGVVARIVDDAGGEVAAGEVGEIVVRGGAVMEGYADDDAATADMIRDGWAHTGDLARRDDAGFLTIVGRKKDMLVSGGINVYPREVELALEAHPDVVEAAVIGVPDEKWGEVPVAFVVARAGASAQLAGRLVEHAQQRLATFKRPRAVHVVDALPKNASGKVLKHELSEKAR